MQIVFLFGKPGSGKSTVSNHIKKHVDVDYFAVGDLFRALSKDTEHPLYQKINDIISNGNLVSDDLVFEVLTHKIASISDKNPNTKLLIDGFPRTMPQFSLFLDKYGSEYKVIYLTVEDELAIQRLSGRNTGRADDRVEVIKKRMKVYKDLTNEVLSKLKNIYEIDASKDVKSVEEQVGKIITELYK